MQVKVTKRKMPMSRYLCEHWTNSDKLNNVHAVISL